MNPEPYISEENCQALIRLFDPETDVKGTISMEDVRRFLTSKISVLLDRNPNLLFSVLYRIDVSEKAVKHAFGTSSHEKLPEVLSDLIIERQIQKIHTRRIYNGE